MLTATVLAMNPGPIARQAKAKKGMLMSVKSRPSGSGTR